MTDAALPVPGHQAQAYFADAQSWEVDRQAQRERSERRAWQVAFVASVVAAVSVVTVALMLPLKATVPYVLYVDKATGNTEVVSALNEREVGYRELNEKYWTRKYVVARESYLYTLLQYDYDTVLALSADSVARPYAKGFDGDNAKDKRLGAGVEERVKVISVVLPPDQVGKAVIRFEKSVRRAGSDATEVAAGVQTFVATMAYEFKPSMRGREKDLIENPLGFKVTAYRVDAEIGNQGALP